MPPSKKRKISTTQLLLLCLEKAVQGGEFVVESSTDLREWMYSVWNDYPRTRNKYAISQAIRRLREKGLIRERKKRDGEIIIKLTEAGREKALLAGNGSSTWDGKWRVVIFDVPEDRRLIRDLFRRRLRAWGFVQWQKSVWATKKNITKPLRSFIKEFDMGDWVTVLEAEDVS